ncbi:MAG: tetratricopeptide repeat protein [Streptomyces sp.]|nr:tetratricopeptide repeat protein [Streptomyces sp.]
MCDDQVRLCILGPLQATVHGRPVHLGGPRAQAVLATLLVNQGRLTSRESLADAVWGQDAPTSVIGQVTMAVSTLRKALREAGCPHDLIQTAGPGYQLDTDRIEVDAWTVERLVTAARATDDPAQAARTLREALDLWRGPVLSGLGTGTGLVAAAQRWEDLRLTVAEEWADLELALGRHRELTEPLAACLADTPLREGLRGRLLIALYRSGRRAEALALYASGRDLLAEELGVDPGPELQQLHKAILNDDLSLGAPPAQERQERQEPVPAELPASPGYFAGRTEELDRLTPLPPAAVIMIDGPGGIGKTALALRAAHRSAHLFPDGQLFVDLNGFTPGSGPLQPSRALARFLRSLGVAGADIPVDPEEAASRFRSLVSRRRMIIVLDNALDAAQIRPLLPAAQGCCVVVTSRHVLGSVDSSARLHLSTLDEAAATDLLARAVGADRIAAEPEAVQRIVQLCGGLPLAVRISAARLTADPGRPLGLVAASMADSRRRLDTLRHDDLEVRSSFETSIARLRDQVDGSDAIILLALLGLHVTPTTSYGVALALTGWPGDRLDRALDALLGARLLERHGPEHVRMHDLLRLFAGELGCVGGTEALGRVAQHHLNTVHQVRQVLKVDPPGEAEPMSPEEAIAWLDGESDNLRAAATQFADITELYEPAVALIRGLTIPMMRRGRVDVLTAMYEPLLAAARRSGDVPTQAETLNVLAVVALMRGALELAEGYLDQALALPDDSLQPSTLMRFHSSLAIVYDRTDRKEAGLEHHLTAARLAHATGETAREVLTLNNLASSYKGLGRWEEALAAGLRGLALRAEVGEHREIGAIALTLAQTYHLMGDHDRAESHIHQALVIMRDCADLQAQASCHWALGRVRHALGDLPGARFHWRQAVTLLRDINQMTQEEAAVILSSDAPPTPRALRDV